jgi:glycerol-3-phosphate dehydrogenase
MPDTVKLLRKLQKAGFGNIRVSEKSGGVLLEGELENYDDILTCGRLAVDKKHSRGVINDIKLKAYSPSPMRVSQISDKLYDNRTPDVLIIGGGIVGCAIARELSKLDISVMLLEKEYDVAVGQSSRNDGMIHAGIDLKPDSIKVKYNMRGNALYDVLSRELDVPVAKVGQYVLFTKRVQRLVYPVVVLRAKKNNIPVRWAKQEEIERKISRPKFKNGGMFFAGAGIVSPYLMTVALAENAAQNGVEFCLNTAVTDMACKDGEIKAVVTNRGTIYPKAVVNAAGVYSDKIAQMAGDRHFTIHPRKGVEVILDKKAGRITDSVFGRFAVKTSTGKQHTKGGGVVRTVDGNVLIGPNAAETPEREDESTSCEALEEVLAKQEALTGEPMRRDIITYFAGTRAATYEEEFIVERSPYVKNFAQAAGIQSPGVTAAPAIAQDIAAFCKDILSEKGEVKAKTDFNPIRKGIPRVKDLPLNERAKLIAKNPDYGVIICRCEEVSKGEILDAIHSPLPAATIDGIKRRVRAGMGRCQGGFCSPVIAKLISEQCGADMLDVCKKGEGSQLLMGRTKGADDDSNL